MALGYAALLRVFPGLLAAGPMAALVALALARRIRGGLRRPETRAHLRFLAGAALAAAILVPASLVVTAGPAAYPLSSPTPSSTRRRR